MELDVRVGNKSLAIPIENPFRLDIEATAVRIESFLLAESAGCGGLDFRGLLPKMIKGIAGCEGGCPADAKRFVSRGFTNFKLEYIEGGILHAQATTENGKPVSLKMFPDFLYPYSAEANFASTAVLPGVFVILWSGFALA